MPPTHKIEKTIQQWKVGGMVDKWTLRPEVRDFCGQFPVYRLEPFTPDSVSVGRAGGEGYSRASKFVVCVIYTHVLIYFYPANMNE